MSAHPSTDLHPAESLDVPATLPVRPEGATDLQLSAEREAGLTRLRTLVKVAADLHRVAAVSDYGLLVAGLAVPGVVHAGAEAALGVHATTKVFFSGAGVWKTAGAMARHARSAVLACIPLVGSGVNALLKPESTTADSVMEVAQVQADRLVTMGVSRAEVDLILHSAQNTADAVRTKVANGVKTVAGLAVGTDVGLEVTAAAMDHVEMGPHTRSRAVRTVAGHAGAMARRVLADRRAHGAHGHGGVHLPAAPHGYVWNHHLQPVAPAAAHAAPAPHAPAPAPHP